MIMTKTMQKSHQNPTSDDLELNLLESYLTDINPKWYAVKSQFFMKLVGWIK